jgi:hypothetical protein
LRARRSPSPPPRKTRGAAFARVTSSAPLTAALALRYEAPALLAVRPEISVVLPAGAGANVVLDVVRTDSFRLHLLDPGFLWNAVRPVSAAVVPRTFDFSVGAGVEIAVRKDVMLTFDWRAFLPSPVDTAARYGDYARLVFEESLYGGQAWTGLSWFFSS